MTVCGEFIYLQKLTEYPSCSEGLLRQRHFREDWIPSPGVWWIDAEANG